MNLKRVLVAVLMACAAPAWVNAATTNTWPFTEPGQYTVSDPDKIEVADGVAKLKRLTTRTYFTTIDDYRTNSESVVQLKAGPDVSIGLQSTGPAYMPSGFYTSQIFDGGGRTWQSFFSRFVDPGLDVLHVVGGMSTNMSGVAALYTLDDTWADGVTGSNGTPVGSPQFTTDAKIGPSAAYFSGANTLLLAGGSNLVRDASSVTYALWVKVLRDTSVQRLIFSYGKSQGITYNAGGSLRFEANGGALDVTGVMTTGRWTFVTCTYQTANGVMRVYVNGALKGSPGWSGWYTNIIQDSVFALASDGRGANYGRCQLDDVAIFKRELSASEIAGLYQLASAVKFQVRSGTSPTAMNTFSGPDGSAGLWFYVPGRNILQDSSNFRLGDRYAQYRIALSSDVTGSDTPRVDAAGFEQAEGTRFIDDVVGDFACGEYTLNTTNIPAKKDTPFLGLDKKANGGYYTNGTYTSRVLDGGDGVSWGSVSWTLSGELAAGIPGLEGLYHFEGGAGDNSGKGRSGTDSNVAYTDYAKLGTLSAVFNGSSSLVTMPSTGSTGINTVEFWLQNENPNDGILELLAGSTYLIVSNGMITPVGYPTNALVNVFVNAAPASSLVSGWNHVAVVSDKTITNVAMRVGVAGGDYMQGRMDELATYSRALTQTELSAHYVMGRRAVGGKIRLQVRTDTNTPPAGAFNGPGNVAGYFDVPAGGSLASFSGRYLQYRVTLLGDGTATPALEQLKIVYNTSSSFVEDSIDEFAGGVFDAGQTRWYGDELSIPGQLSIGAGNLDPLLVPNLAGLWHLDEETWPAGLSVLDSAQGNHGLPEGTAAPVTGGSVGMRCGSFTGAGDVLLPAIALDSGDFTVAAWFKTSATNRGAILSFYGGGAYHALEFNGNGAAPAKGKLAFVLNDGSSTRVALANRGGLNDNQWHHAVGMRNGRQMHVYVDGVLEGTTDLGLSFGSLGSAQSWIGKYGNLGLYFQGLIDEALLAKRALTTKEIGSLSAAGAYTAAAGSFTSPVFGTNTMTIWESLAWGADAPYSRPLGGGDSTLMLLWHLDFVTNGTSLVDSSSQANTGTLNGGTIVSGGRFGNALRLADGAGQYASRTDNVSLETTYFTVEGWINPSNVYDRVIVDKRTAVSGYRLGLDASGRPYFWLNGTTCAAPSTLRSGQWTHIAGTYDYSFMRLYVNGTIVAKVALSSQAVGTTANFLVGIGYDLAAANGFYGLIDEVAFWNRALSSEEVLDHYRAGAVTLRFQARSWTGTQGPLVGPDGTTNTFFTDWPGSSLLSVAPLNQYFQFKAYLASEDCRWPPRLQGMSLVTSHYPQDNPYVTPSLTNGLGFLGNLVGFSHVMATNDDSAVRYQISGDNGTNWYYWNAAQAQWEQVASSDWNLANYVSVISGNIGTFFSQLYPKTGGTFSFKALLHSEGNYQTALDLVRLGYSTGRIVVTAPNGDEVGPNAWLVGVTNIIRWTSTNASANVIIEFSDNGGTTWQTVNNNAPNTGSYAWLTPGSGPSDARDLCRIRVRDPNDATIGDISDANFQLVYRYRLVVPNGGEKWYIGTTNAVVWQSPPAMGLYSWLYYNRNGSTTDWARINNQSIPNVPGTTNNTYLWSIPTTNIDLISEHARMRITLQGSGAYEDMSDNEYVLAGIGFLAPDRSTAWKRGNTYTIRWISAGAGTQGVDIAFSSDGVTYSNIATAVTNVTGTNTYVWTVAAENPTPIARIRIIDIEDPKVRNVSDPFTVADVDVKTPKSGDTWPQGTTNAITWTAGGAGNSVNIYYSTNDGTSWIAVQAGYTNYDFPVVNSYAWTVPKSPGDSVRVKVESTLSSELFSVSPRFSISGVRVAAPNGGESWRMGDTNRIEWAAAAAGGEALIEFSYNNGATFTNVAGPGYPMIAYGVDYVPDFPSVQCRARVTATAAGVSNVTDMSDNYFTVAGLKVTKPVLSAVYTMGVATNGSIVWYSAGTLDDVVDVSYAPEDGSETVIVSTPNKEVYPGDNTRDWTPLMSMDPSDRGHIRVVAQSATSGSYTGLSATFTLRGVRITQPSTGTVFRIGTEETLRWLSAGFDPAVVAYFYLSTDGGVTYGSTPLITWDTLLNLKQALWTPESTCDPTTNAVVKLVVTNAPIAFQAVTAPFTLRGLKVLAPVATNNWAIGSTNTIRFLSAAAGNLANIYYASDGVTFDLANPIALNVPMSAGLSTYVWAIESTREPSAVARIKVQSASQSDSAVSEPFTVGGIKVLRPQSTDIWAMGETNRIQWMAIGTSGTNTIELVRPDNSILPIASNRTGSYYDWVIPTNAVGSNLVIRITDVRGYRGQSQPFRIVTEPTISVIAPQTGEFWKLTDSYTIQWAKAGNMGDLFAVEYSLNDFLTSVSIAGTPVLSNGVYSLPWTPSDPAKLGAAKIRVTNISNTNITDTTKDFYLVPKLEIRSPNGGEQFYALKPTVVEWYTKGDATAFDLYYSTDLTRRTGMWVKVNTAGPITGKGHDQLSQYLWTVANVKSPVTWLRIQDAGYTEMYTADVSGPYDDCDATFAINYYTINWRVYNAANSNALDQLSVTDSSGWSATGLKADPYVTHEYPYGVFNTVWAREFFYDKVVFNWIPEPSRTIDVPMNQSEIAPDYRVMANFVYDATTKVFRVTSWLERGGKILTASSACTLTVFDGDGNKLHEQTAQTPDAVGVFWQTLPDSLESGRTYFVKVDVVFSGVTYSSGVTFQLQVPAGQNQAEQILGLLGSVGTNVTDLATAQAAFRTSVSAKLDALTNAIAQIPGLTNIQATLDTQTLARLDMLTNTIGVIGPNETNLLDTVRAFREEVAQRTARILTRPTTVKLGADVSILFRSRPQARASIIVSNLTAGTLGYPRTAMTEMAGGVYEKNLKATWGTGDCLVACSDELAGYDSMIIKVTLADMDDLATFTNISASLSRVESLVTGMSGSVSNINRSVGGIATNIEDLIADVSGMYTAMSNIQSQVSGLSTNISSVNWTNLFALSSVGSQLSNVVATVSNLQSTINWSNITTILGAVNSISNRVGGLTNLPAQVAYLTNVIDKVTFLTNLAPQVSILTNAITQIAPLTNFAPQLTYITNTMGQVVSLTNLTSQMAGVTSAMGQISVLTNFGPQISYLTNAAATLSGQEIYLTNLLTRMSGVTNLLPQVAYLTNVIDKVTFLTNLAPQVSILTNAITQIAPLTNFAPQLTYITNTMGQVVSLTNLTSQMAGVTSAVGQISSLTNYGPQISYLTNAVGRLGGLTNITVQMAYLTNAVAQLAVLTNIDSQISVMTNAIREVARLTNIADQVADMTNSIGQVARLTNMPDQVAYLTNVIGKISGVTNIADQVADMTNSIGKLARLTNMPDQVAYLTNVIAQLGGITNLGPQVDAMTNAIGRIVTLTNLADNVNYLTNAVGRLTALTNLSDQVAAVTNIGASVTRIGSDVTNLLARLSVVSAGVSNLQTTVNWSDITALAGQVAGVSNDISALMTAFAGVNWTNLGQVSSLGPAVSNLNAAVDGLRSTVNWTNVLDILDTVSAVSNNLTTLSGVLSGVDWTNVATLGPRMDTVYTAVTGLQGVVNWADVTTLLGLTEGVSNDLALVRSSLDALNWTNIANVATIGASLSAMSATVSNLQTTIRWSDVASLQAAVTNYASVSSNAWSSIQDRIGADNDASSVGTVFGRLAALAEDLATVGDTAANAVSMARSAKTQASSAAGAANTLRTDIGQGQVGRMLTELGRLRGDLNETLAKVKGIPDSMSTEGLVNSLRETMTKLDDMSKKLGYPMGQPTIPEAGSVTDQAQVTKLLNSIEQAKAMMEAMRMLMEEAVNKPVVVDWIEGVQ